jgi:hypothetical protein
MRAVNVDKKFLEIKLEMFAARKKEHFSCRFCRRLFDGTALQQSLGSYKNGHGVAKTHCNIVAQYSFDWQ